MKGKDLLVGLSVVLNLGLLAYLLLGPGEPPIFISTSFAQNRAVAGGGYAATTADVSSSRQALWVVDNREKRMIVYVFPSGKKKLTPIAARDLRRDFGENLAGNIMLLPGEISGQAEAVYAIDPVGKKLIAYYSRGKDVEVAGVRNLDEDFKK